MVAPLSVWMNGEHVGVWSMRRGSHTFEYQTSWLSSRLSRSLSLSLPRSLGAKVTGEVVENYFDNLLPDAEHIRKRLQKRHKTNGVDAFELLSAIGRDCVGAVQLLPVDESPDGFDRTDSLPMSDAQVEAHLLRSMSPTPMGDVDDDQDFRISIAGAQEKTALLLLNGKWRKPTGMTPTTHILKLPLGMVGGGAQFDMRNSVENEWLCMQWLGDLGFPVAKTAMAKFGATKALVSERFDRAWRPDRKWIARLPQEDFCQVLGRPSNRKYESQGGPGIADAMGILRGSERPDEDRMSFLLTQFAFWLLAATDGHGKNFSVSIHAGDAYRLTPLYDVLSAWPIIGPKQLAYQRAKLAMAIRATHPHWKLDEIRADHWHTLALKNGLPDAWPRMKDLAERAAPTLEALSSRLPDDFPSKVYEPILKGVRKHADAFLRGAKAVDTKSAKPA